MPEIRDADAAVRYIVSRGILLFLPCSVPGFSLYENMEPELFETDVKSLNPWYWRFEFAYEDDLFYGQFFDGRLGFVRRDLFPAFAALRRGGRTTEAMLESDDLTDDAKTFYRALPAFAEWTLPEAMTRVPPLETRLETIAKELQTKTLLFTSGFRYKRKKTGEEYGWPASLYARPDEEFDEPLEDLFAPRDEALAILREATGWSALDEANRRRLDELLLGKPKKIRARGKIPSNAKNR